MKRVFAVLAVVMMLYACGGDGPTSPQNVTEPYTVNWSEVSQTQNTTPQPAGTPAPDAELSYIEFNADGSGKFCALPKGGNTAYLTYTAPLDLNVIYGHYTVTTATNTCVTFAGAAAVGIKYPWCGVQRVQIDANQDGYLKGRHVGHVFADVSSDDTCPKPTPTPSPSPTPCIDEWIEQEPIVTYGEWGECKPVENMNSESCSQSRTKTTVINEKNTCTGVVREKSRKVETESKPCDCACVEKWEELPPVYGEWGECKAALTSTSSCAQTRTVTINEKNSCTGEIRLKSKTEESKPCECACVEEWIAQPPVVTYSEWGECKPTAGYSTVSSCSRSRTKRTVVEEVNSCTQARRVKSDKTETETEPCDCPIPACLVTTVDKTFCVNLPSSKPDDELAWLNTLGYGYFKFAGKDDSPTTPWIASANYYAVLLKSGSCALTNGGDKGTEYRVITNVKAGTALTMKSGKDISHVSIFDCK